MLTGTGGLSSSHVVFSHACCFVIVEFLMKRGINGFLFQLFNRASSFANNQYEIKMLFQTIEIPTLKNKKEVGRNCCIHKPESSFISVL